MDYEPHIVTALSEGKSCSILAKELGVERLYLRDQALRLGYRFPNLHNRPKFDYHIFDKIDTEEKAYWLGLLFADGAVSSGKKRNVIELTLALRDKAHLEKFNRFLKNEKPVKFDDYRARVVVTRKHLKTRLIELGCTPRKSLTLKYPHGLIPSSLERHFIRGYVDGDGSISQKTNHPYSCIFQLLGTPEFLQSVIDVMDWRSRNFYKTNKDGASQAQFFAYSGEEALSNLRSLYDNSNISLERKFNKFKDINLAVLTRNS